MEQRPPARPWPADASCRRRRLLVESGDPALAISDFSVFSAAGFDVALCQGPPEGDDDGCPLLRGGTCDLVDGADVVLHALGPDLRIVDAVHRRRPDLGMVVEYPRGTVDAGLPLPGGCIGLASPASVPGQLDALRRAMPAPLR